MSKSVGEPLRWESTQPKRQRYRFKVRVIAVDADASMFLTGHASPETWGFVLLGPGNVRLRKISKPQPGHVHPDKTEAEPKHKHYWTEQDDDLWTYVPSDIRWDDLNHALIDFARECNIVFLSVPDELRFQGPMELGQPK
jgi:hypothetical protein